LRETYYTLIAWHPVLSNGDPITLSHSWFWWICYENHDTILVFILGQ